MKYFRESNIEFLNLAIQGDQYDDVSQRDNDTGAQIGGLPEQAKTFINLYLNDIVDDVVEIGLGSGAYPDNEIVTHVIEPAISMIERFGVIKNAMPSHYTLVRDPENVVHGVIECMPDEWEKKFSAAMFLNGIFQVRSDYEAFLEVNRILKIGGLFLFNVYTDDSTDIICGRVLGAKNYVRILKEFGFELVGYKEDCGTDGITYICVRKSKDPDIKDLRKLQLIPVDVENKIYKVNNLNPERDWAYL